MSRNDSRAGALALLLAATALSAALPAIAQLSQVDPEPVPASPFAEVAAHALPSVVSIRVQRDVTQGGMDLDPMADLYRRYFPGQGRPILSISSAAAPASC